MPREIVTVQIGQCGNQIGTRFWDMVLSEHAAHGTAKEGMFDESMSTFFRNVDDTNGEVLDLPVGNGTVPISSLRARAILVDMEEGVVNEVAKGPLGELFDQRQYVTAVSGSGNNWAHGHMEYGRQYADDISESVRQTVEYCDSLQSFFLMHSLGGGTGSGLGTYILGMLEDQYSSTYRFTTAVFPSEDDDVITSPYNSVLAINELVQHASCVLPIENQALLDMCAKIPHNRNKGVGSGQTRSSLTDMPPIVQKWRGSDSTTSSNSQSMKSSAKHGKNGKNGKGGNGGKCGNGGGNVSPDNPFDAMNNIAAHLLTSLTSSMRFPGALNVDLNEITTNLVPYPRLHFLMPSLSPLFGSTDVRRNIRSVDQMFTDAFSPKTQLIRADPRRSTYLACALMVRGRIQVSDVNRNIERMRSKIRTIYWNHDGFKVGICATPSARKLPVELLCLANNTAIAQTFETIHTSFQRIFKRRAHVHHYTQFMEEEQFIEAQETLVGLVHEYQSLETAKPSASSTQMIQPII
jgi:tubulin epsilon